MSSELYHHGIKGMHWGIRRTPEQLGRVQAKTSTKGKALNADKQQRADRKSAMKNRRSLSDQELRQRIERLKLEKQLKDLTAEDLTPGRKFVKDVLTGSSKAYASTVAKGAMLYGTKAALTGEVNIKDLAGYVAPKPKNK